MFINEAITALRTLPVPGPDETSDIAIRWLPNTERRNWIDRVDAAFTSKIITILPPVAEVATLLPQCTNLLRSLIALRSEFRTIDAERIVYEERKFDLETEHKWWNDNTKNEHLAAAFAGANARITSVSNALGHLRTQRERLTNIINGWYSGEKREMDGGLSHDLGVLALIGSPGIDTQPGPNSPGYVSQYYHDSLAINTCRQKYGAAQQAVTWIAFDRQKAALEESQYALEAQIAHTEATLQSAKDSLRAVEDEMLYAKIRLNAVTEAKSRHEKTFTNVSRNYDNRAGAILLEYEHTANALHQQSVLLAFALNEVFRLRLTPFKATVLLNGEDQDEHELATFSLALSKLSMALDDVSMRTANVLVRIPCVLAHSGDQWTGECTLEAAGTLARLISIGIEADQCRPCTITLLGSAKKVTVDLNGDVIDTEDVPYVEPIPTTCAGTGEEMTPYMVAGGTVYERPLPLRLRIDVPSSAPDIDSIEVTVHANIAIVPKVML